MEIAGKQVRFFTVLRYFLDGAKNGGWMGKMELEEWCWGVGIDSK